MHVQYRAKPWYQPHRQSTGRVSPLKHQHVWIYVCKYVDVPATSPVHGPRCLVFDRVGRAVGARLVDLFHHLCFPRRWTRARARLSAKQHLQHRGTYDWCRRGPRATNRRILSCLCLSAGWRRRAPCRQSPHSSAPWPCGRVSQASPNKTPVVTTKVANNSGVACRYSVAVPGHDPLASPRQPLWAAGWRQQQHANRQLLPRCWPAASASICYL